MDYKSTGVDIEAGEGAVRRIKDIVKRSYNSNVLSELGSFGGLYSVDLTQWRQPVLVSSTDGVGTKLLVAQMAGKYDTVGQDLVNHCVNDIFVMGAVPQFFLDYIGISHIEGEMIEALVSGMTTACIENEMSLVGGEMAEMPDIYRSGDFDLVGTIVGIVERANVITGAGICEGDVVLGLPSSGLHTNGFTLAREIIFGKAGLQIDSVICGQSVAEQLLSVHRSYYPILRKWAVSQAIHGMAHITGGGIIGNLKRVIPSHLCAMVDSHSWEIPPFFQWLVKQGELSMSEAFKAFNMGIGFIVVTSLSMANEIMRDTDAMQIGKVLKRDGDVAVNIL